VTGIKFTPNRRAAAELERSAGVTRLLGRVADEAAAEAQQRLPYPKILGGIKITGASSPGEGRVVINGSGWHLWEYGTKNHGPRPAVRPGVQAVIARYGGRWKSQ
jgi:hypothetical protein